MESNKEERRAIEVKIRFTFKALYKSMRCQVNFNFNFNLKICLGSLMKKKNLITLELFDIELISKI